MKLEATCDTCGRLFLLQQTLPEPAGTGGRCPFCGTRFGRHYVQVLPEVIREADESGQAFSKSLETLGGMGPGFSLNIDVILQSLAQDFAGTDQQSA
ncbi:MAG: hypothetical protein KY429_03545 [Actinobacteria bacterium]|nr:hypothetical protein [Actinomycetota bacterium]